MPSPLPTTHRHRPAAVSPWSALAYLPCSSTLERRRSCNPRPAAAPMPAGRCPSRPEPHVSPSPLPFDPIAEARRHWREHGWDDAAEGMAAVTSLMRAQQLMLATIDAQLRPLGLTFARYEVLMLLYFSRTGALPLGKVGQRLQVHPTSITSAMDKLQAQGFVRRRPHPSDRRTTLAEITDAGRAVAREARSEEHTSELQSRQYLVCRLLLEKKQ